MKNLKFILLLLIFLSSIYGCKKAEDNTPETTPLSTTTNNSKVSGNVKTKTYTNGSIDTYAYDSLGRCTSIKGGNLSLTTYDYTGNIVTTSIDGRIVAKDTINSYGYCSGISAYGWKYLFDSDGHHISIIVNGGSGNGGHTYNYTWIDGNIAVENTSGTIGNITTTYSYLVDKTEYRSFGTLWNDGKGSKNLVSRKIRTSTTLIVTDTHFVYEYDSKGRVSKETVTVVDHDGVTVGVSMNSYTYFD